MQGVRERSNHSSIVSEVGEGEKVFPCSVQWVYAMRCKGGGPFEFEFEGEEPEPEPFCPGGSLTAMIRPDRQW